MSCRLNFIPGGIALTFCNGARIERCNWWPIAVWEATNETEKLWWLKFFFKTNPPNKRHVIPREKRGKHVKIGFQFKVPFVKLVMLVLQNVALEGAGSSWLEDPRLIKLAEQENLTSAQLLLNWAVSQGVAVLPSARSKKHMEENLACCQKALSVETLSTMSKMENPHRTIHPDPRWIYVPGVATGDFGGPVPPSHAHLNLFGGVEQFHFGQLRQQCWTWQRPDPCCDPAFGPEGLSSCWTETVTFMKCCLPPAEEFSLFNTGTVKTGNFADFVVVGAGSAGSVAASRLASKGFVVVLVESGGEGFISTEVHPNPSSPDQVDHWFVNNVEWTLGDVIRSTQLIHGRGLGGSSMVNGRIYTRTPLPFSAKMVSAAYEDVESELSLVSDTIPVGSWQETVLKGFVAAGVPYRSNASMSFKYGIGPVQKIAKCRNGGKGLSSFHCAAKSDVEVVRHAHVDQVIFENGKAVGVEVAGSSKNSKIFGRHGVVLSAGALQTPMILVRSGIGHPKDLQRLGIQLRVSSPEVGANLQDHSYLPFRLRLRFPAPWSCSEEGSLYAFFGANLSRSRTFELQLIPRCRSQQLLELKGYLMLR